jgi:hypothetical protein
MNILFTILAAFPIGFFVKQRGLAIVTYLAIDALLFSFQTLGVLLDWMAGNAGLGGAQAFGPFPTGPLPLNYQSSEVWGYGAVNLVIVLVGIGLTVLGAWVAARRATKDVVSVD